MIVKRLAVDSHSVPDVADWTPHFVVAAAAVAVDYCLPVFAAVATAVVRMAVEHCNWFD